MIIIYKYRHINLINHGGIEVMCSNLANYGAPPCCSRYYSQYTQVNKHNYGKILMVHIGTSTVNKPCSIIKGQELKRALSL